MTPMLRALVVARLGVLFSSMFRFSARRGKVKKRGPVFKVFMVLLVLYIVAALCMSVGGLYFLMAGPLHQMGLDWLYFAMGGVMAAGMCFVGSVFTTQSQLFTAKDNELLLSMPIPTGYILISRMLTLLALNYLYTLLILGPALAVWIWQVGMSAAAVACFCLAALFLPLISLALSSACGWLIGLITSRLRRSNFVTIALFITFMGLYMYGAFNIQAYLSRLIADGAAIGAAMRSALPPAYWFGTAAMGDITALLLFLACCTVPFGLVYWLISRSFNTILTTKKGAPRIRYQARAMRARGAGTALLRRELGRFFGTPIYVFNAGFGAVMHIALAVAVVWKGPGIIQSAMGFSEELATGLLPVLATAAICFCSVMVMTASASVSLEGRNLWIIRAAPVSTLGILHAKLGVNLLAAIPTGLVASLTCLWVLPSTPINALCMIALPVAVGLFASLLGLCANLLMPRLDWVSEAVVVKQSASVMVSVFGGMAAIALPVILYFAWLGSRVGLELFMLICLGFFVMLCGGLYAFVRTRGVRLFEAL